MNRLLSLRQVCESYFTFLKPSYLRRIASDQQRPVNERRYPARTHERFPRFEKHGRSWVISETRLRAFL